MRRKVEITPPQRGPRQISWAAWPDFQGRGFVLTSSDGVRIDIMGADERTKAIADACVSALNDLEKTEHMKRGSVWGAPAYPRPRW